MARSEYIFIYLIKYNIVAFLIGRLTQMVRFALYKNNSNLLLFRMKDFGVRGISYISASHNYLKIFYRTHCNRINSFL